MMHELVDTPRLTTPEADYLVILGNLIEEYEKKNHPIEDLPPHEMLAARVRHEKANVSAAGPRRHD